MSFVKKLKGKVSKIIPIMITIDSNVYRPKKGLMVVQPLNVYLDEPDTHCSELAHCTDEELEIQEAEILYDKPVSLRS